MRHWGMEAGRVTSRSMLDELRESELRLLAQLEEEAQRPTPPPPVAHPAAGPAAETAPRPLAHAGGTSYLPIERHLPDEPAPSDRWRARAACRGVGPAIFFPARGDMASFDAAKAFCASCPVTEECWEFSTSQDPRWGVWGGLSVEERQRRRASEGIGPRPPVYTDVALMGPLERARRYRERRAAG